MDYYGNTKLDFIDCYLIARKEILNNEIITLDNDLVKEIKNNNLYIIWYNNLGTFRSVFLL